MKGAKRIRLGFCQKIYLSYFLLVCVVMGAVALFSYSNVRETIYENVRLSMSNSQQKTDEIMSQALKNIQMANNQIYYSQEFQGMNPRVNADKRENAEDVTQYFALKKAFNFIQTAFNDCTLRIYVHDNVLYANERRFFYPMSDLENECWLDESREQSGNVLWGYGTEEEDSAVACVRYVTHGNLPYVIYASVDAAKISRWIANPFASEGGFSLVTDGTKAVYSPQAPMDFSKAELSALLDLRNDDENYCRITLKGQKLLCMRSQLPYGGWSLIFCLPQSYLQSSLSTSLRADMIFMGGCLLAAVMLVMLIGRIFTRRIRTLVQHMENIDANGFKNLIEIRDEDEISLIERKFNEMCLRLQESMVALENSYEQKRKAELMALQAQINPHFLYNTLDAINWMAIIAQQDQISDMVSSLGRFFRLSLSRGKEIITVKEEVDIAREYAKLQRMRNADSIEVVFDIDPAIESRPCPKLLLQPIIENAIKHGKHADSDVRLKIEVRGEMRPGNYICMIVRDNGKGIQDIQTFPQAMKSGYGLNNIRERLRLHFGDDSRFEVENNPGGGVCVTIKWRG